MNTLGNGFHRRAQALRVLVAAKRSRHHQFPLAVSARHNSSSTDHRPDPFARRPNKKCDPYGQGGKPLSLPDARKLLSTISDEWRIVPVKDDGSVSDDDTEMLITREFVHADFISGSSFLTHIAAVAQVNDHFPSLTLERKLDGRKKAWTVVSSVKCHTKVLQGLSHHDFFLATVSDC